MRAIFSAEMPSHNGPSAATGGRLDGAMRILIVEDDRDAASYIVKGLKESGHAVDVAYDGKDGLFMAASDDYDTLVVDRMLPGMDGLKVVQTLRATGNRTPVLFLSALGEVDDRVRGLRAGGDDYLVKPYAFSELLARVEALGRRRVSDATDVRDTVLTYADLSIDLLSRAVSRAGREIDLQPREFKILEVLLRHPGQVMTRTMLLEKVWDYRFDPQTNVIDVHISRLRQKVDRGFEQPLIHTIRGAGYSLRLADKAP